MTDATFHRETDLDATAPTLIEGLPGTGLVASIAVEQITDQLDLERHGTIRSPAFPQVASFADGLVQDTVRVYAGSDPDVMTLHSDVPIPESAFPGLRRCVMEDLAEEFERAIFLAGAPTQSEEGRGSVYGVATTEALKAELEAAGIEMASGSGAVGGVTGALATASYHADVPAALLLVTTDPRLPDPAAAQAVIETALEPLVDFDVDTSALEERSERIQERKRQVARQLQNRGSGGGDGSVPAQSMFQ